MSIFKLKPACKDYLWGGERLKKEYGIEYDGDPLAEAWVLSCHPDGLSVIDSGEHKGKTLSEYIGRNADKTLGFPVLIKLIDAKQNLSIQVHPDDEYAMSHEGQKGKTEMWYILDSAPDAFIYYGFKKEISKEEFEQRIRDNTITEVLNKVRVKKGEAYFIKAGTLHAIGAGCLIAEVQQNSNVTYRIYDYDRVGADGKRRELHIDKALDVTDRRPPEPYKADGDYLASCEYF
ncbi:MAG: class I mannose-6-phosphate isomerase, partial [Lachnospiraceae bacterium]|nr:class I mannose-6-phosphate isomerase [Lachnospiraceae bacterium]